MNGWMGGAAEEGRQKGDEQLPRWALTKLLLDWDLTPDLIP